MIRVVTEGAVEGFAAQLRERGFEALERREARGFAVGDARARLVHFAARCPLGALVLDVDGYAAVWPAGGPYLLAGGAYPTGVREGDHSADGVRDAIDPERFRSELLGLIRSVR